MGLGARGTGSSSEPLLCGLFLGKPGPFQVRAQRPEATFTWEVTTCIREGGTCSLRSYFRSPGANHLSPGPTLAP